jgi:RNA polymerase sigma-70 factor (ECF subfamily)
MGVAVILGGQLRIALRVSFSGDRIAAIEAVADAEEIAAIEVEVLER